MKSHSRCKHHFKCSHCVAYIIHELLLEFRLKPGMWCVSHTLQIFVCSWKSGICTYRASKPNPVQHLCWPTLKSERLSSDLLQENMELHLRVWIVQAILPRARAGMPEEEESQVPVPSTKSITWFYALTHLCPCFSFILWLKYWRTYQGLRTMQEKHNCISAGSALVSAAFVSSWLLVPNGILCSCAVSARCLACPQVFKMVPDSSNQETE